MIQLPLVVTAPLTLHLKNWGGRTNDHQGMKRKNLEVTLNCSADKFYWKCENDCNDCLYLGIDAKTGNIIEHGRVVYQY